MLESPGEVTPVQTFDLQEIEARALVLMRDLGQQVLGRPLADLGWQFGFDRARRRLGCCRWRRTSNGSVKRLTLSKFFAESSGWKVMEDVTRHEIAHAIDLELRGRSDHGSRWKHLAVACGADPTRLYEGEAPEAGPSPYVGVCPACGKGHSFYRRLRRAHGCPDCCDAHNGGRYAERFKLTLVERATSRVVPPLPPGRRSRKRSRR